MGVPVSFQGTTTQRTDTIIQVMPSTGNVQRKEGELLKYKNVFNGWGKRYFRLERSYLHYFEAKHNHAPIATITRGEINEVKPSNAFPGRLNVFQIIHKSGVTWYCQASNSEEMLSWMQALSTVPIVLEAPQYPMAPQEQFPPINPAFVENDVHPLAPSPYRGLMDDAHQIAYASNTPHECRHYSPPPPYSSGGNRTAFASPPEHTHNPMQHHHIPAHYPQQ